jgi:hypothetical protein
MFGRESKPANHAEVEMVRIVGAKFSHQIVALARITRPILHDVFDGMQGHHRR